MCIEHTRHAPKKEKYNSLNSLENIYQMTAASSTALRQTLVSLSLSHCPSQLLLSVDSLSTYTVEMGVVLTAARRFFRVCLTESTRAEEENSSEGDEESNTGQKKLMRQRERE